MARFRFSVAVGLLVIAPAPVHAAGAPTQLQNKTITMSWSTSGTGTSVTGGQRAFTNINTRSVYVSTAGRTFLRMQLQSTKKSGAMRSGDVGPNEGGSRGSVRFEGNRLVGTEVFRSGARQFIATFDSSFSSCTLNVIDAKSGADEIKRRGPDGAMYTIGAVTTGSPSCSIQSGNAFAGQ